MPPRSRDDDRGERRGGRGGPGGGRGRRRKACFFLTHPEVIIDYKDIDLLRKFISERGKILPRRRTGNSPAAQRKLSKAIKRAREIGLLPYSID